MHVIDDLILFINSLDSSMFGISNVVCEDQKQHVLEALKASFGFLLGCWVMFFVFLQRTLP
jgi:hypothetical protein